MSMFDRAKRKYSKFINTTFSNLLITGIIRKGDKGYVFFEYRCVCGNTGIALIHNVLKGRTESCGCLLESLRGKSSITHHRSWTPEWTAWCRMRTRCYNPNDKSYRRYGGRGIKVCERWLHSFENFFSDLGLRPSSKHSLGRIDNDGNYEPSNCEWQTVEEQMNNMSRNRLLTANNETMTMIRWARHLKIDRTTIERKLKKGQSFQEIHDKFAKPRS